MFKLLDVNEATMTRFLLLENIDTGTVDCCFDDSALKSNNNFEFMQVGEKYDCKIELFGKFSEEMSDSSIEVKTNSQILTLGKKCMIVVQAGKDIYYVPQSKYLKTNTNDSAFLSYTRKDLIQVDSVVHADYLR